MPFDPNLFFDAVHKTYAGERMQTWVTFMHLVPLIEQRLASGAWPKPVPQMAASLSRLRSAATPDARRLPQERR
jgi:hypothetical protein